MSERLSPEELAAFVLQCHRNKQNPYNYFLQTRRLSRPDYEEESKLVVAMEGFSFLLEGKKGTRPEEYKTVLAMEEMGIAIGKAGYLIRDPMEEIEGYETPRNEGMDRWPRNEAIRNVLKLFKDNEIIPESPKGARGRIIDNLEDWWNEQVRAAADHYSKQIR